MKIIFRVFFLLSLLLLADVLLYFFFYISLAGYYSDLILFWLWFFSSIAVIILYWKKLLAKLFLILFFIALILSILPMMIPFFGFFLSMTGAGLRNNQNLNKNYRAQIVSYSTMVGPNLEIIEKMGILERRSFRLQNRELEDLNPDFVISHAKDIIFKEETDSSLSFVLFFGGPNILLTFDKQSGNLKSTK